MKPLTRQISVMAISMRKIRVFLRADQKAALKSISARTGLKQSDLVRKSVDLLIEKESQEDDGWREATRLAAGMWRDRTDVENLSRRFRTAAKGHFATGYGQG